MRSTVVVAVSLACVSYVSATFELSASGGFGFPFFGPPAAVDFIDPFRPVPEAFATYPGPYPAGNSFSCGNQDAFIGVNVGNDINCVDNAGGGGGGWGPGQDVSCLNQDAFVAVNVLNNENCAVNGGIPGPVPYPAWGYPFFEAKDAKDSAKDGKTQAKGAKEQAKDPKVQAKSAQDSPKVANQEAKDAKDPSKQANAHA